MDKAPLQRSGHPLPSKTANRRSPGPIGSRAVCLESRHSNAWVISRRHTFLCYHPLMRHLDSVDAKVIGYLGGKCRSAAKIQAAKRNGLRGGRPRLYPPCPSPYAQQQSHAFVPAGPRTYKRRVGKCRWCGYRPRAMRGTQFRIGHWKRKGMRRVAGKYVPSLFWRATVALQKSG
jgi:hypothetical protein